MTQNITLISTQDSTGSNSDPVAATFSLTPASGSGSWSLSFVDADDSIIVSPPDITEVDSFNIFVPDGKVPIKVVYEVDQSDSWVVLPPPMLDSNGWELTSSSNQYPYKQFFTDADGNRVKIYAQSDEEKNIIGQEHMPGLYIRSGSDPLFPISTLEGDDGNKFSVVIGENEDERMVRFYYVAYQQVKENVYLGSNSGDPHFQVRSQ